MPLFILATLLTVAAPARVTISVVGTSDTHGRLHGLPVLGGYLHNLRAARPGAVVLVDAGDSFQGTLESDLDEGATVVEAFKQLGYDAAAIGNHEFDYGPVDPLGGGPRATPRDSRRADEPGDDPRGALKARIAEAAGRYVYLAANLRENGEPLRWPNVKTRALVRLPAGVDVGIIGITTRDTPRTTIAKNFTGLAVSDAAQAVRVEAAALRREGAQVIVVAAHAGGRCKDLEHHDDLASCDPDSEIFALAQALSPSTVDVIVAGHTHAGVAQRVNGVAIIESFAQARAFGRVDVDVEGGKVVGATIYPPQHLARRAVYEGRPVAIDREVEAITAAALARAKAKRDAPLGATLSAPMPRGYHEESALGDFVASMMRETGPAADVAVTNGGGLRADLPAGPLTYGSLYDALPFENRFALVRMSGAGLRHLIAQNLASEHGVLLFSGLEVRVTCEGKTPRIVLRREGQTKPVKDADVLRVLTSDFLATGGDNFGGGEVLAIDEDAPPIREAIAARLRQAKPTIDPHRYETPPRLTLPMPRPVRCEAAP